jgi:hypothetical protein
MIINFNELLKEHEIGYVRKIISIKHNPDNEYGMVCDSKYYDEKERNCVECENNDCFIINILLKEKLFNQNICWYYLVVIDDKITNKLSLLSEQGRTYNANTQLYPYPENIFVKELFKFNFVKMEE